MSDNGSGPLPGWLGPLARVAAHAYGAAIRVRGGRYESSASRVRARIPVVSVGNITAGGTGKTPFVRWCVEDLRARGHSPLIALRGYRSRGGLSDEAQEYRALLPGVPIAVGADRAAALARALAEHPHVDCAVLDDAFQHRRLARDLDIVLVDATRPGLDGDLLPAGWLREAPEGLRRASMVVVTRAERIDPALSALIERYHGKPPAAWTRHAWTGLDVFDCEPGHAPVLRAEPVGWLNGRSTAVVVGIGNPEPFVRSLAAAGARIESRRIRADHAHYSERDAARIATLAAEQQCVIATTWKDWTKLGRALARARNRPAAIVAVPRVAIEFIAGIEGVQHALHAAAAAVRG